mmetsp:Transcript_17807/g.12758  ORF Transcript_17807/g.12758 Transcript_17807/m.12758 type:complete len:151 (-) Transcript_17807:402-854(-)
MITGSAPIDPEISIFFQCALSIHITDCYGQTEAGAQLLTSPKDVSIGHSGGPLTTTIMRLKDCPELEYLSTDKPYPRGELQYRGSTLIKGYFKNEEKTKELFDEEGYVNSGDIALVLPNGAVKIIDRVKNIFKLAQGEYISPEKIENIYT